MQEGENQADPQRKEETAHANGVAPADRAVAAADADGPPRSAADLPPAKRSRLLRSLYWALWFVLLPIALASILVWALTPPSGSELSSGL
ncbi:MAG TPA: hypothetical protein VK762_07115, partial [Polyangiaceae bacterium]|nr:hypothetical protein [Polyangiaceae bacterium]